MTTKQIRSKRSPSDLIRRLGMVLVLISVAATVDLAYAGLGETGLQDTRIPPDYLSVPQLEALPAPDAIDETAIIRLAFSNANTGQAVAIIDSGKRECASAGAAYAADCLASVFESAAASLARHPDYDPVRKELLSASKKLKALVAENEDKEAPKIRKRGKRIRAVKKASVAAVNRKAQAIVTETATKLLRSAGNSEKRKVHYTKIAKAVESTKTILRST
ncbi:MAG: hypothetical protein KDJ16_04715 [Hyphomicrobiales bacterium]|nr:hypothetical protein [Hyphomicrobiales bacterium]